MEKNAENKDNQSEFERINRYISDMNSRNKKYTEFIENSTKQMQSVLYKQILENLRKLSESGKKIEIRIPIIPSVNDAPETILQICHFLQSLPNIPDVQLLPYHDLAHSKYQATGLDDTLPAVETPDETKMAQIRTQMKEFLPVVMLPGETP